MSPPNYPFEWVPSPPYLEAKKEKLFAEGSNQRNMVMAKPWRFFMPKEMLRDYEAIYNFEIRPDDVWLLTYPKCGTTWTQEMLWQIMNNVDTETALKLPLFRRAPFLELQTLAGDIQEFDEMFAKIDPNDTEELEKQAANREISYESIRLAHELPSPRVIKTHLPLEMLPPKLLDTCKVVFVGRNPKDCMVSYYHHTSMFSDYKFNGDFKGFADLFINGEHEYGSYWEILKSCYKHKDHPNMKIIWYEDMKRDLINVIRDMAKFLGKHLTEYRILKLDDHLYIDNFRKVITESNDPMFAQIIRKGKVGDWKNYFDEDKNKVWNQWIQENLQGTDIKLSFE